MASVIRQPFAPLDEARLQSLTSTKNKQNALSDILISTPKRKAAVDLDFDINQNDFENVDPLRFSAKRAKNYLTSTPQASLKKPLVGSQSTAKAPVSVYTPSPAGARPARAVLTPKSPAARLLASLSTPTKRAAPVRAAPVLSSLSTPAGRSPPRGKKSGILSRRRTLPFSPYGRASTGSSPAVSARSINAAPFGLDAALKGTIKSYKSRHTAELLGQKSKVTVESRAVPSPLGGQDMKASWFFDIHEDTPEQDLTNMLQHSTCVLDISSDEETESKMTREQAEGRDKENVPPFGDVSQTSGGQQSVATPAPPRWAPPQEMEVVKDRSVLGELDVEEYYAAGCDPKSVFVVPPDDDDETSKQAAADSNSKQDKDETEAESTGHNNEDANAFDLWEGDSAKGDE